MNGMTIAKCDACGGDVIMRKTDYVSFDHYCGDCRREVLECHVRDIKDATECRHCRKQFKRVHEGFTSGLCSPCSIWAAEHYREIRLFREAAEKLPECARCMRRVTHIDGQDLCEDCAAWQVPCKRCGGAAVCADICDDCWDTLDEEDSRRRNHNPTPVFVDDEADESDGSADTL